MSDAKWWLVSYDVRDEKRLRKCAKHMEGYGMRVQYSVFRCWMTSRDMERLRWELTELRETMVEILRIPLCGSCADGIVGLHGTERPPLWTDQPPRHRII